jgi:hypothetical protein
MKCKHKIFETKFILSPTVNPKFLVRTLFSRDSRTFFQPAFQTQQRIKSQDSEKKLTIAVINSNKMLLDAQDSFSANQSEQSRDSKRLFVAIELSTEFKALLNNTQRELKKDEVMEKFGG